MRFIISAVKCAFCDPKPAEGYYKVHYLFMLYNDAMSHLFQLVTEYGLIVDKSCMFFLLNWFTAI